MVKRRHGCLYAELGGQERSVVDPLGVPGVLLAEVVRDRGAVERVNDLCGAKWFIDSSDVEGEGAVGGCKPAGNFGGILGRREADNAAVSRVLCRSKGGEKKVKRQVLELRDDAS